MRCRGCRMASPVPAALQARSGAPIDLFPTLPSPVQRWYSLWVHTVRTHQPSLMANMLSTNATVTTASVLPCPDLTLLAHTCYWVMAQGPSSYSHMHTQPLSFPFFSFIC